MTTKASKLYKFFIDVFYICPVFHDYKTVFGIAKFHRKVGHLSQYVRQLPNPLLEPLYNSDFLLHFIKRNYFDGDNA